MDTGTTAGTVVQLMLQAQRNPPTMVAVESNAGNITFGALRMLSNKLANGLIGLGLEKGDRVAYVSQNCPEYVILEFALLKAGLVKVPLNYRLTPSELRGCLELAEVRAVLADLTCATALDEVLDESDPVIRIALGDHSGWRSFESILQAGANHDPAVATGGADIYHIRFSSGSTGKPKGIAISHAAARSAILGNTWVMSTSAPVLAPRTLQVAPLVYASGWSVLPTLLRGGTNVIAARFDADETLQLIRTRAIDWMFAVPTMLRRMSESSALPLLREARIGCLMLAGEHAALSALEAVSQHTDALVQCWGQTEAPASTTLLTRQEMQSPQLWPSIGRPIPGVELSLLVDGEVSDELVPNVDGELVIRSATVTSGLLGAAAEYDARRLPGGWWRTSDIGRFDDEGRIYIVGRASEMIITGGTNIQPVEIERALEAHAAVHEAVVVGVPDERWGETPAALVYVPQPEAFDSGEIAQWLAARLPGFKRPGHLFVSSVPIPRQSGESKVARHQLKSVLGQWCTDASSMPTHVTKVPTR